MDEDKTQSQILTRRKIKDLVDQVDPNEKLEPEVENILLEIADEFIENVTRQACILARHRQSDTLEVKDLNLVLESAYNIRIPGFGTDEVKQVKKAATSSSSVHQQRLNQVKKAIAADTAEKEKEKQVRRR